MVHATTFSNALPVRVDQLFYLCVLSFTLGLGVYLIYLGILVSLSSLWVSKDMTILLI